MYIKLEELLKLKDSKEYKRIHENFINESFEKLNEYDIFLSHATIDVEIMKLVKAHFEIKGKTVYVAELENPLLKNQEITKEFANLLQEKMNISKKLCYVLSPGSTKSYWMPWELGYFDGEKGSKNIQVLTVSKPDNNEESYLGHEYLKLYPHCDNELSTITKELKRLLKD